MSSLVDATAALSVTDERPDALAPAPPTCVPSDNSHSSPPGMAAARVTRRRFDAEPGVHIKLDKRGDGVAPVEGDTVQVNYSGRVKGKSQCRNATDLHAIDATEPTHRSMSTQARRLNSIRMTAATPSSSRSASGKWWLAGSRRCRSSASAITQR
jgi:hypothetical protein